MGFTSIIQKPSPSFSGEVPEIYTSESGISKSLGCLAFTLAMPMLLFYLSYRNEWPILFVVGVVILFFGLPNVFSTPAKTSTTINSNSKTWIRTKKEGKVTESKSGSFDDFTALEVAFVAWDRDVKSYAVMLIGNASFVGECLFVSANEKDARTACAKYAKLYCIPDATPELAMRPLKELDIKGEA